MSDLLGRLIGWSSALEGPVSVAFSGGMDSLLVALCARKFVPVRCVVVGTPASDDIWHARRIKARHDLKLEVVELSARDFERHARLVAPLLQPANAMTLNLSTVLSAVAERAAGSTVITGLGADELFLGYRKYGVGAGDRPDDLRRLRESDIPRYAAAGSRFDVKFRHPFMELADGLPAPEGVGKPEVAKALVLMGVPERAIREKRAMQFGSGAAALLRGLARLKGMTENDLVLHYMEDKRRNLI